MAHKKVKQEIKKLPTVGDLIKKLQEFPESMVIGVSGHYGEYHELLIQDIRKTQTFIDDWMKPERGPKFDFVNFPQVNLGEEPD